MSLTFFYKIQQIKAENFFMTYSRKTFLICIYRHLKLVPQATTSVIVLFILRLKASWSLNSVRSTRWSNGIKGANATDFYHKIFHLCLAHTSITFDRWFPPLQVTYLLTNRRTSSQNAAFSFNARHPLSHCISLLHLCQIV